MQITFHLQYHTQWGQRVAVLGDQDELPAKGLLLDYLPNGQWRKTIQLDPKVKSLSYRYALLDDQGNTLNEEWQHPRILDLSKYRASGIDLYDTWRPKHHLENGFDNTAFSKVIFKGETYASPLPKKGVDTSILEFRIQAPRVEPHQRICLLGNSPELGDWDRSKPILLGNKAFPIWSVKVPAPQNAPIEYKYGIYDTLKKELSFLEEGPNRSLHTDLTLHKPTTVVSDIFFRHPAANWKGAGLSIPVFSLRTKNSFGVGAFSDIRLLVDWAQACGMKMVQILPINDTTARNTWKDSYPYASISVFALHPLYLDITQLPGFEDIVNQKVYRKKQAALNKLDKVDYEGVIKAKLEFARQVFDQRKAAFLKSADFKKFLRNNGHWLKPYAFFCTLRDQYKTPDFNQWEEDRVFSENRLKKATSAKAAKFDEIAFYYYLQYHLDRQLLEVANYARDHQIVLKGDIPIGIYRYSVDAWTQPDLYHMDGQSGAPPDPFSDLGQNWGFPTYNWPEMAKDGYRWWQNRLKTLSRYFDAFRIDHILGFFRIWQIPYEQIEGTLGYFNAAIPVTLQEFQERGIHFDYDRFCKPYITKSLLEKTFGDKAKYVTSTFLEPAAADQFRFKAEFDSQRKVDHYFQKVKAAGNAALKTTILRLHSNVLFIEEPNTSSQAFHPRIDMQKTHSYQQLDGHLQHQLDTLYHDYFYHRQEDFWREQAMTKLPAIKAATDMLICGEDLGMIPACVPEVMRELDLFTLEIQRMSKNPKTEFLQAVDVPYFSVCSPSSHDMSPIRLWWEEMDADQRNRFYHQELQLRGEAPGQCTPLLVEKTIRTNLDFPSMWAVFPIQDLLGMDEALRHPDPMEERINIPANPEHYWQYRLHLDLEALVAADNFNRRLATLLKDAGRS